MVGERGGRMRRGAARVAVAASVVVAGCALTDRPPPLEPPPSDPRGAPVGEVRECSVVLAGGRAEPADEDVPTCGARWAPWTLADYRRAGWRLVVRDRVPVSARCAPGSPEGRSAGGAALLPAGTGLRCGLERLDFGLERVARD